MEKELLSKLDTLVDTSKKVGESVSALEGRITVMENSVKSMQRMQTDAAGLLASQARNAPNEDEHVKSAFFACILRNDVASMNMLRKDRASAFAPAVQRATTDYHNYTTDNASGGYAVPTSVFNELARIKEQSSVLYPLIRKIPQGTAVMTVPTLSTKPTFGTAAEAGKVANTKPVYGVATLTFKRRRATIVLTKEMMRDTVFGPTLAQLMVELLGEADGADIDKCCFQDNTDPFTGLLYNTSITDVTMKELTADAGLNLDYMSQMQDVPLSTVQGSCLWFMSRTVLGKLRRVKDSTGQPLLAPAYQNMPATILGNSYRIMDNGAPTLAASTTGVSFMIFGDMKHCWMGEEGPMEIEMSGTTAVTLDTTMTSMFENGMLAIAGETRRSFAVVNTGAFARLTVG